MKKKFIVGSNAFFKCYDDFNPNDIDVLYLNDDTDKINIQIRLNDKNK